MIYGFYKITNEGEILEPDWHKKNIGENFQLKKVVGFKWIHKNKEFSKKYSYGISPDLLPNSDGLILTEKSNDHNSYDDELVVYNADGGERFRIRPPQVTKFSNPGKAFFYYASILKNNAVEVVFDESGEGHEYRATLDPQTGELSNFRNTRV